MPEELLVLLDRIVARAAAGEGVEAYGVDRTEVKVKALDGEVESLSSARSRGVGVRVINDGRVGYAYTADTAEAAIEETLAQARSNAAVATPDGANVLPDGDDLADLEWLYDPAFADTSTEDKVEIALRLEAAARGAAAEVKGVDTALYGDEEGVVAIASTAGVRGLSRRCEAYVLVEALARRDGASTAAYGLDLARVPSQLDVDGAASEAADRAVRLLGGTKPKTARLPVLLDPLAAASVLSVLADALTAEAVQKGRSLFADRVGDELAGRHVTLVDDGRHRQGAASAPWDDEGVPTGRTTVIEQGRLRGFLHNSYTARRGGTTSTGNARRAGFRSPPGVASTNLYLEPGPRSPDELRREAGDAFYCQQILGVHSGANPVSGDFSVGAAGLMVRDGQVAEPVREATIAGTIPELLAGVVAVGADLRFLPLGGSFGGATLLIDEMTVAGA